MTLRLASFGVRGFVGESLTPRVVMDLSAAFASFVDGGRVLIARDTRYSSPMFHSASISSLLACGCEVVDFGVCPTPMLQFSVPAFRARGAVSISGGHTGMGWNALTLIGGDGAFLGPDGGEAVLDRYHATDFAYADPARMGAVVAQPDFASGYFRRLSQLVDVPAIRAAGFTVLIDPVAGAGCPFIEEFARTLGFRLVAINGEPSGYLPREPEPRPRSALQLAAFIRHVRGSVGFVLSSDMGRLSVVTEDGEPASEEYTFALVASHVLKRSKGPVVTNCCTTRMIDDLARENGVELLKTQVGQAFVMSKLTDEAGVIGGEGSGSAAVPRFSPAFDGFVMMALILEAMALTGRSSAELVRTLPRYHMVKRRIACGSRQAYRAIELFHAATGTFRPESVNLTDGVRLDWADGWLHARASHTEQLIRVISEARDRAVAEQRAEESLRILGQGT